ncbi:MAG: hypothetical protein GAK43_00413 [Stenotrophomonas maltophilia]|nr:MAG: hypothetical protein GAK43_00413 [Stenotrophomonas maltophilia]
MTPARLLPRRGRALCTGLLLALALGGCAQHDRAADAGGAAGATANVANGKDQFLAYEHDVRVRIDSGQISARLQALSEACRSARFGDCTLLELEEGGRSSRGEAAQAEGAIRVRLAPDGVAPFIALAGKDGRIANRSTRAEDLAQQVADTRMTQERLQREHEKLSSLQQRADVKVADLLAISQRLAEIEAGAEAARCDAAQQRRRIDTQLVSVHLQPPAGESGRSEIGEAVRDFGGVFTTSVAFVIRAVAALVPVGVVLWVLGWIGLRLWRRRRRS